LGEFPGSRASCHKDGQERKLQRTGGQIDILEGRSDSRTTGAKTLRTTSGPTNGNKRNTTVWGTKRNSDKQVLKAAGSSKTSNSLLMGPTGKTSLQADRRKK